MKKIIKGIAILSLGLLSLAACGSNAASKDGGKTEVSATKKSSESNEAKISFKNQVLTGPGYKLTIDKTQVGHDNSSGEDGLIIWYTVNNNTKENIIPKDIFSMFTIDQQDSTSDYDLTSKIGTFDEAEALYPTYNPDRTPIEDVDASNKAGDEQNSFNEGIELKGEAKLLPGKSVQCVTSVVLNNKEGKVVIKLGKEYPTKDNQSLVIDI